MLVMLRVENTTSLDWQLELQQRQQRPQPQWQLYCEYLQNLKVYALEYAITTYYSCKVFCAFSSHSQRKKRIRMFMLEPSHSPHSFPLHSCLICHVKEKYSTIANTHTQNSSASHFQYSNNSIFCVNYCAKKEIGICIGV